MNEHRSCGKYTLEFNQETVRQVKAGRTAWVVAKTPAIPTASLTNWIRADAKGQLCMTVDGKPKDEARHRKKSRGVHCAGRVARYAWIRSMKKRWPITLMCEVLELSPSGYFSWDAAQRRADKGPGRPSSTVARVSH